MNAHELDRRGFLKLAGGGIVVFVSLGGAAVFDPDVGLGQQPRGRYPDDPNAYLRIDGDGKVWIFSGKIEMGQGVMTSQAQMAAEELGVPFESIHMILGDTDQCPWDMGTFGSLTTRMFGPALRAAAAEARVVLIGLAAAKLAVAKGALVAENGVVYVAADRSRKVSYAELAQGKHIARLVDGKAVLRAAREFAVMGKSPKRVDGYDKVTGRAKYAGDIRLPGMLYARLLRPPAHGATLKSVDVSAAKAMAGVTVVQQGDLVAVLHADPEVAGDAVEKLQADWNVPQPPLDPDRIFDHLVRSAPPAQVRGLKGDPDAARAAASHLFVSTFRSGYRAHSPMEPHTAVAELKDGKMTVWASTQTPFPTRDAVARALNLPGEKVRVITPFVGGGFGGKSAGNQAVEAARLASLVGKPVQVAWTRREEFFYDSFDPASQIQLASAVDGDGHITLWDYNVYSAGERGTELFYDVPNARIGVHGSWGGGSGSSGHIFAVGPWRAPGANTNIFAGESQIDIMAAAAKIDPLEFRLRNTRDARMRRVLQAVASAFGWKAGARPTRAGCGLACGVDAGTYVASMAEVDVDRKTGEIQVKRVVTAQDMGIVVNPDGARMQMEGCITMGLGYTLREELRFRGGEVLDRNFGTYRIPRFSWLPEIETVLVPNDELAPQGGGEPAIVVMGAVVANALFDATGARLYRLPLTPERVLAALQEKA